MDVFEEKGEPVFDLDLGSHSDSQDSSDDEYDDEDIMANLPDHLSRSVRGEGEVGMFISTFRFSCAFLLRTIFERGLL